MFSSEKRWEWRRSEPHLVEETGRRANQSRCMGLCLYNCASFLRLQPSSLSPSRNGSRGRPLGSVCKFLGKVTKYIASLPTLDPRLQVPAYRTSNRFS
ncbi:hypothetical protein CY34DRAFT_813736 [Suillus luteus UH-Slu-Lm8-n1]|uniref:Uncharacterized protein n=1 Tax=Suillus luteus UH-Slu-Lm8-n1 TaxID=930992 RepID=A0A0C9ZV40_9AGAM|nr:hypothetical protein CY34DRAFT_813736 [Suillus luteus UH-Slu-Lm8-n1]